MHWYLTIPFALGIFFSPNVGAAWWWLAIFLLAGLLTMWVSYRQHVSITAVFLLNSFLLGSLYGHMRLLMEDEGRSTTVPSHAVLRVEETLSQSQLSEEHRAELNAMLLGDRTKLAKEEKVLFRNAGVQHLLALSGMHLSILLALLGFLLVPVVRFGRWRWPAFFLVMFLMWFYAYMVGMPKSLLRAVLMASLFLLGKFSLRPTKGYDILATAVLVMLVVDPLCAFDIGAQLSVSAMVGLTVFFPVLDGAVPSVSMKCQGRIYSALRMARHFLSFCFVSLSAWLFTLPLILFYFHSAQPWQPLVSVVMIPVTSAVLYGGVAVMALGACGFQTIQGYLSEVLDRLMDAQDGMLSFFTSLPMSNLNIPNVSWGHVAVLYLLFAELWVALRYRSMPILLTITLACFLTFLVFVLL